MCWHRSQKNARGETNVNSGATKSEVKEETIAKAAASTECSSAAETSRLDDAEAIKGGASNLFDEEE